MSEGKGCNQPFEYQQLQSPIIVVIIISSCRVHVHPCVQVHKVLYMHMYIRFCTCTSTLGFVNMYMQMMDYVHVCVH